jgi:chromosome segregation ATPase
VGTPRLPAGDRSASKEATMPFSFRTAAVSGALCLLVAATAGAAGPASAGDTSPDCVSATAQVTTARDAVQAARAAVRAAHRPLGQVMVDERKAARAEVRTSRAALRGQQRKAAHTRDRAERKALQAQIKGERADIRHGTRLLDSKHALLAQIKADRKAAKAALRTAVAALRDARAAATQACADTTEPDPQQG